MPERQTRLDPREEDYAIFKGSIAKVDLDLTPLKRETRRGDLMCIAYIEDTRIEVVFPGRRRHAARGLEKALDVFVRNSASEALAKGYPAPHAAHLRFPMKAEGIWRVRLKEAGDDEVEKIYQFLAAYWTFRDPSGQQQSFGESPIRRPVTRSPIF